MKQMEGVDLVVITDELARLRTSLQAICVENSVTDGNVKSIAMRETTSDTAYLLTAFPGCHQEAISLFSSRDVSV